MDKKGHDEAAEDVVEKADRGLEAEDPGADAQQEGGDGADVREDLPRWNS